MRHEATWITFNVEVSPLYELYNADGAVWGFRRLASPARWAMISAGQGGPAAQQLDNAGETREERPSVELERVTKRFDEVVAVRDLSLGIAPGEFFTLLGPSGCGKTTTLRIVAGFEAPSAGGVRIDGEDMAARPPHRRPTNTVFQTYALFPHLSVEENVAFGLRRKKVPKEEIARRVEAELDRVGLAAEARRRPNQLSGGQQQRVALARALVNLPKVLLLDEPLGALDLKLRKGLQIELKRIQREVGITFVYVTHDQEEALTMSDRIAVMDRGAVEQVGSPEDVYERPATTFVAGFIGVSNLLPAEVVSANGNRAQVRLDGGPTVAAEADGLRPGERCYACVRPEKLRIEGADAPVTADHPSVEGTIESTLYLGTSTQLVVRAGPGVPMTVLVPNADEAERQRLPNAGSQVRLAWSPEHMHVVLDSRGNGAGTKTREEQSV
jgi:spermidine/putrescine transport system ATP-binding protein